MTKNHCPADKISAGIYLHLEDETHGRRSLRWLAEKADISYSTLQGKLSTNPDRLNVGELFRIADALNCDVRDLYADTPEQNGRHAEAA